MDNQSSDWGPCEGAIGPATRDSCLVDGDDANCDGNPNGGCACVEGQPLACGPETNDGICQRGTRTCVNGMYSECVGAAFAERRDCTSNQDNDCDGRPDNTLDDVCTCTIGSSRACGEHPGQDGNGQCRGGRQTCVPGPNNASSRFGACVGSVGPAGNDSCTVLGDDSDCSGVANTGCQCIAGRGNAPCSQTPNTPRCNAQGFCAPCQSNNDCSLVGGGRTFCDAGRCTTQPVCGDGVRAGGEVCDGGQFGSVEIGSCNPECTGFYLKKRILATNGHYATNMNGIAGADGICNTEFGNGWKALLVGGRRRATVTPYLGDGQLDWVLQKYRHYYNADDQLIWRTDDVALLAVRGRQHQNVVNLAFDQSSGFYPWSGYDVSWTTFPDTGARGGTCGGWTSNDPTGFATFAVADFSGGAFELCGGQSVILCVEQ